MVVGGLIHGCRVPNDNTSSQKTAVPVLSFFTRRDGVSACPDRTTPSSSFPFSTTPPRHHASSKTASFSPLSQVTCTRFRYGNARDWPWNKLGAASPPEPHPMLPSATVDTCLMQPGPRPDSQKPHPAWGKAGERMRERRHSHIPSPAGHVPLVLLGCLHGGCGLLCIAEDIYGEFGRTSFWANEVAPANQEIEHQLSLSPEPPHWIPAGRSSEIRLFLPSRFVPFGAVEKRHRHIPFLPAWACLQISRQSANGEPQVCAL